MNIFRYLLSTVLLIAVTTSLAVGSTTKEINNSPGAIQLHKGKHLNVTYRGKALIVEETIGSLGDPGLAAQHYVETVKDGTTALNLYRIGTQDVDFRREAALSADGILELTVRAEYKLLKPIEPRYLLYSFALPVELFAGSNWKIRCGMEGGYDYAEGKFGETLADGEVFNQRYIRFMALEKDGLDLVIDFNPYGPGTFAPYTGEGDPAEMAYSIIKRDDKVVFSFFKRDQPEFFGAKIQLYSGKYNFDERHPFTTWDYISGPADKKPVIFIMGQDQPDLNVKNFGSDIYKKDCERGWLLKPKGLKLFGQESKNIFRQGLLAAAGGKGELVLDARPGVYMFTATCGYPEQAIGPFTIKVNDEIIAKNVKVSAGYVRQIDAAIYLRAPGKQLKLSITGKNAWAINSFAFQTYMYQSEDFAIDRGYWFDDKLPELMPGDNIQPRKIRRCVLSANVLPEMKLESGSMATNYRYEPEVMPPARSPDTDWIWNLKMVEFNGETALNRQDKSVVRQRLINEVKDLGLNTLNEMSLSWYTSHQGRWAAHKEIQKEITAVAHELGIKVVRHLHGPVVLKRGTGPRFLVEHIGLLNRDSITGLPTMSTFCINNPKYWRMFFDNLMGYVTDTNVDGVMVDESYFRPINYCGCVYCRNKFEADTGCILPLDSASQVMMNQQNPIWLRWITWRYQAAGDFFVALRKRLNTIRPAAVVMAYDNEIDLMDGARVDISLTERELARGCDLVGTEGDAVNIYANYRNHYMFRKISSSINASYGRAGWGLFRMNPGNTGLLFASWAMQQMNRQGEWSSGTNGTENNTKQLRWPDAMPAKNSRSLADVAILYTADLRYTARFDIKNPLNFYDAGGFSQVMTDAHIPHMFLQKRDLQLEKLKQYKVLILASAEALGPNELVAIKEYVNVGGTLVVSGAVAATYNNYLPYTSDPLSELTGVASWSALPELSGNLTISLKDGISAALAGYAWRITAASGAEVIGTILSDNQVSSPGVIVNRFGKGVCITSALPLGKFNCEPLYYPGQKWTFQKNTQLADVLLRLVNRASGGKYPIQKVDIPQGVIIESYIDKKAGDVYIHLLNMTAPDKYEFDKVLPLGSDAISKFPEIHADIVCDIAGTYTSGYASSPDFPGHREIKLSSAGSGCTRITLSRADLNRYTLLLLKP